MEIMDEIWAKLALHNGVSSMKNVSTKGKKVSTVKEE